MMCLCWFFVVCGLIWLENCMWCFICWWMNFSGLVSVLYVWWLWMVFIWMIELWNVWMVSCFGVMWWVVCLIVLYCLWLVFGFLRIWVWCVVLWLSWFCVSVRLLCSLWLVRLVSRLGVCLILVCVWLIFIVFGWCVNMEWIICWSCCSVCLDSECVLYCGVWMMIGCIWWLIWRNIGVIMNMVCYW